MFHNCSNEGVVGIVDDTDIVHYSHVVFHRTTGKLEGKGSNGGGAVYGFEL